MLPSLNALRAFEAAARHLSFKKAAEELFVTPTAISHQIKALEGFLGVMLFRRLHRGLMLTDQAQLILPEVRGGFDCFARAMEKLANDRQAGVLTVAAAPVFAAKWLVPRLDRFNRTHPGIEIRISAGIQIVDYARDGIDIGIRYGVGRYPNLRSEPLLTTSKVYPVCSPALAASESALLRNPEDLGRVTLLHYTDEGDPKAYLNWAMWLHAAGVADIDFARGPRFNRITDVITAAIEDAGVALVPESMAEADLQAGRLVRPFDIGVPVAFSFYLVYQPEALARPEVASFREWILTEAGKSPGEEADTQTGRRLSARGEAAAC